jgi:hypothetical protein
MASSALSSCSSVLSFLPISKSFVFPEFGKIRETQKESIDSSKTIHWRSNEKRATKSLFSLLHEPATVLIHTFSNGLKHLISRRRAQ